MSFPRVPFHSVGSILRQGTSLKGFKQESKNNYWSVCTARDLLKEKSKISISLFFCTPVVTSNLSKSWALLKLWNSHLIFKKHLLVIMDISVQTWYGYQNVNMTHIWIHSLWPVTVTHLECKQNWYVLTYFSHMLIFYNLKLLQ